ncbi:hypothetical protein ACLX1H_010327 [Fusarium chlamydosporum]
MKKLLTLVVVTLFCQLSIQQAPECSKTKLCETGCCSSAGYCGLGPDFFGKHGFCGYTEDFCGKNDKLKRTSCSPGNKPAKRVIGYYEAWSTLKRPCLAMAPEEIPFGMYTHIIFSFATINPKTFTVSAADSHTEYIMSRIDAIKVLQPDIKIWVALGGWAFNDPGPTQSTFSDLAASSEHTNTFLESLSKMMDKYGFDGVDIDWEYPVTDDRHGKPADYKNAVKFMKKIRAKMNTLKKAVSMALPASYWYLQGFDIQSLESTLDWFNIMTYDVHGSWDIDNKWTGPWVNSHTNMTEIQMGLDLFWRDGISPSKITMGMGFYSRTFTLTDPKCSSPGCRISSAGNPGRCSDTAGVLLHPEIEDIIKKKKLSPQLDRKAAVKMVSWDNQWASFDDLVTWRLKTNIARSQCIEGFMVWAISHDDSSSTNAKALNSALGRKTPKLPEFKEKEKKPEMQLSKMPGVCHWTSCFEECPSGYKSVQRDGHKEIMLDTTICDQGLGGYGFSRLCCPADHDSPTCTWRGHRNSGHCKPGCKEGEVEVGTIRAGCDRNHQSACCELTEVTEPYDKCYWSDYFGDDDLPPCIGKNSKMVATSSVGSGGIRTCSKDKTRAYCCSDPAPVPFGNHCEWVKQAGWVTDESANVCEAACHKGQICIALEHGDRHVNFGDKPCKGKEAFCCDLESELEKRKDEEDDEEETAGSIGAREFKALISKYLDNPTCPATILQPDIYDGVNEGALKKRDLVAESMDNEMLHGRAVDCTLKDWNRLLTRATLMFTAIGSAYQGMLKIWDNDFADPLDEEYTSSNLQGFFGDYRMYDRRATLAYILYNPHTAGRGLRIAR